MDVREFLLKYQDDLPKVLKKRGAFDDYEKWLNDFHKKTLVDHCMVKQSYFEQTKKLINEANYSEYYGDLGEFAYLGLFDENDEEEFSMIINNLALKLDELEDEDEVENILGFLYTFMDFILHEYYPERKLLTSISNLRLKIVDKKAFDKKETGELVLRFINLMK